MPLIRYTHDLLVRLVVLGWIYAQKPLKTPLKGHNFQVNPPVQARDRGAAVVWSLALASVIVAFALMPRTIRQPLSTTA